MKRKDPQGEELDVVGLWRILQDLEDGTLAAEERDCAMILLQKSPAARTAYFEYFEQAAMLHAEAATHAEQEEMLLALSESGRSRRIFQRSVLAAAAVLALSAIISALIAVRPPDLGRLAASAAAETRWAVDGETQDSDSDEMEVVEGSSVQVFSGTVKLRLESGLRLVLQGPAEVAFPKLERPVLKRGWLWIDSGGTDASLLVETPELLLRDIGTRFGVRVRANGLAEIHLIEGMVEASSKQTKQQLAVLKPEKNGVLLAAAGQRSDMILAQDPFPGLEELLASPANYSTTILSQRPVGYWKLDDSVIGKIANENPDGSVGQHGLEVMLAEAGVGPEDGFYGFGEENRAVSLAAGTEKSVLIMLGSSAGVSKREGAVAFWVRRLPDKERQEILWMAGDEESGGYGAHDSMYANLTASGQIEFFMENGRFDVLISSHQDIVDGHWHQVVASWGSTSVDLYLDGMRVAQDNEFRVLQEGEFSGRNVRFGKPVSKSYRHRMNVFTGWVDEIALWNRSLTALEVSHQFHSARGRKPE